MASFQNIDSKFKKVMDTLTDRRQARLSIDPAAAAQFKQYFQTNKELWKNAKDHYGCSILYDAFQNGNHSLVRTLIDAGTNLNIKERCGATPLTLVVIKGDEEIAKCLLMNFAICNDRNFTSVPGPKQIMEKLGLETIINLIDSFLANEVQQDIEVSRTVKFASTDLSAGGGTSPNPDSITKADNLDRCQTRGQTLVIGDQDTNKIERSAKEKSSSA